MADAKSASARRVGGSVVAIADPGCAYLSQLFQAEGLEMAAIRQRASRPQGMGTLYWTLNDVWPGQINSNRAGQAWGRIDFYNRWKASHHRARRFYAPATIGAQRIEGVTHVTLISDRVATFRPGGGCG